MEGDPFFIIKVILFFVFTAMLAFFSGAEAAFFSLSKEMLDRLKESPTKSSQRIVRLLNQPMRLLTTMLVGNTMANVAAITCAVLITAAVSAQFQLPELTALIVAAILVTLALLVLGELAPKIVAVKNAYKFAFAVAIPLAMARVVLYPIVIVLNSFPILISGLIATRIKKHLLSREELKTIIEVIEEKNALEEDEKEMIHSIFEFSKTTAKEIMVPRIDMVCADRSMPLNELIDLIITEGYTRIPIYEEKVDNILGVIHAKALLPFIRDPEQQVDLVSLARPVLFVPGSKPIDELLKDFQIEKQHMAVVVDEYGGTAGLITLEDVIEEIVGEIQDEYDSEKPLFKQIGDNQFLIDAKIDLDVLNEELDIELPMDQSYESLGGFIFSLIGSVPEKKQEIAFGSYKFIIEKVDRNRIMEVLLIKPAQKNDATLDF